MSDTLHLREIASAMKRLWWIPFILAIGGLAVGLTATSQVPPIYRAEATVLVGPTEGTVTHTSTVRTSENLAGFYADLARRQIILEPVTERLELDQSWAELRNNVKAVVPSANLRLVTVTVMGDTQDEADRIANAMVRQLVSLSPAQPTGNSQAFVNEQVDSLKQTIREAQENIDRLETEAGAAATPEIEQQLRQQALGQQERLVNLQRVYVELVAAEPTTDAGGLTVIDEASAVTDLDRPAPAKLAIVGAVLGASVGMVVAWLSFRRGRGRHAEVSSQPVAAAPEPPDGAGRPSVATRHPESDARYVPSPGYPYGHGVRRSGRVAGSRRRTPVGG